MVYTPDKHKVKFDQNDEKSKSETYEIAKNAGAVQAYNNLCGNSS